MVKEARELHNFSVFPTRLLVRSEVRSSTCRVTPDESCRALPSARLSASPPRKGAWATPSPQVSLWPGLAAEWEAEMAQRAERVRTG